MTKFPLIDIIIPVYQPVHDWAAETAVRLRSLREMLGGHVHLIVVNDGTADYAEFDHLKELLEGEVTIVHLPKNAGKGNAIRQGMRASSASVVLYTDADFPYTNESMFAIAQAVKSGADVALGYREQDYYASVPWFRKGMSVLFRFLLRRVLHSPITDTQCGLKGMNERGREVFLNTTINRFLVDLEFIKLAVAQNSINIVPVVVHLRSNVVFSKMGLPVIFREAVNFVLILFK